MSHDPMCPVAEAGGSCCPWMGECDCQCMCDWIQEIRQSDISAVESVYLRRGEAMSLKEEHDLIRKEMAALNVLVSEIDLRSKIVQSYLRDTMLNDDELEVIREVRLAEEFRREWPGRNTIRCARSQLALRNWTGAALVAAPAKCHRGSATANARRLPRCVLPALRR